MSAGRIRHGIEGVQLNKSARSFICRPNLFWVCFSMSSGWPQQGC